MGALTIDPKNTEDLLLTHEDVLDASVWYDGGSLRAHVTVAPGARIDESLLKSLCTDQLGAEQTPHRIEFIAYAGR